MKIFCVGRNYVAHAQELANELHYECELVLRISKNGKYIQDRFANKYYDAISVGIDFTARDIQNELKEKGLPWEKAKAWDNSAAIGKWIPLQNVKNKKDLNFCLYKNKELVQQGNSSLMINSFDKVVAYISNYFSVNIGDLVFTGTPAGVGECVVGDELEIFIEDDSLLSLEIK